MSALEEPFYYVSLFSM